MALRLISLVLLAQLLDVNHPDNPFGKLSGEGGRSNEVFVGPLGGRGDEEDGGCGIGVERVGKRNFGGLETLDIDNVGFGSEKEVDGCAFTVIAGKKIFCGCGLWLFFTDCLDEGARCYKDLQIM